jgi:hypothetical protein
VQVLRSCEHTHTKEKNLFIAFFYFSKLALFTQLEAFAPVVSSFVSRSFFFFSIFAFLLFALPLSLQLASALQTAGRQNRPRGGRNK